MTGYKVVQREYNSRYDVWIKEVVFRGDLQRCANYVDRHTYKGMSFKYEIVEDHE